MALKVEDGTGGDALISLQGFKDYCGTVGHDLSDFVDDTEIEQAIRRASTYVSNSFRWQGFRVGARAQIQAWPRSSVTTDEGWAVDFQTIPREVTAATAEATWYELNNPGGLTPVVSLIDRVISETIGPISTTYAGVGIGDIGAARPVLVILSDILRPLLANGSFSRVTTRATRG